MAIRVYIKHNYQELITNYHQLNLFSYLWYVLKISFQLFLVDFGVDLGARPQGHSELWPKGLSPKMPKSNKNNGR